MDCAAYVLSEKPNSPIICLDADTQVDANYLAEIHAQFQNDSAWAAVVAFAHPIEGSEREQESIVWYETFLRYWALGLRQARSPYAYHSIGSAIACTAEAYASAGGMNRRRAGEDFYFLQELAKTGNVSHIRSTVVRPSARVSDRVPFGTGRRMTELQDEDADRLAYHPDTFDILRDWIAVFESEPTSGILGTANAIAPPLAEYLGTQNIESAWEKLECNASSQAALVRQRHRWFDAFRTLKCLHHLRDNGYPDQPLFESVASLLTGGEHPWSAPTTTLAEQADLLHHLRKIT